MWRPYGRRGDPTGSAPQGGGLGGVVGVRGAPRALRPTEAAGVDAVPRNPGPRCQEGPRLPESRSRDSKAPQSFVSPSLEIVAPGTLQGAPASEARALREGVDPRPQRTAPGARPQGRGSRRGASGAALGAPRATTSPRAQGARPRRSAPRRRGARLQAHGAATATRARRDARGASTQGDAVALGAEVEALGAGLAALGARRSAAGRRARRTRRGARRATTGRRKDRGRRAQNANP